MNRWNLALATLLAAGAARAGEKPLELACMDRFDVDRFHVGCWAWGLANTNESAESFLKAMAEDGFTAFLTGEGDITFQNYLMKVTGPMFRGPAFDVALLDKYDLCLFYSCYHVRAPRLLEIHDRYGDNPRVLGYQLNDNCDLHPYTYTCALLLARVAPRKIPWVTTNPNPIPQSRTGLPITSGQNYPFAWFADDARREADTRRGFCDIAEGERLIANRYDLANWPIVASCNQGTGPSQYRFQFNAAAAYGAQSVWTFVYARPQHLAYGPAIRETHHYLSRVAGPHLLGRRCVAVLHGSSPPPGQRAPGPGELIESMDGHLLAGLLVPDVQFQAGVWAVDAVYVTDTRTAKSGPAMKAVLDAIKPASSWDAPSPEAQAAIAALRAQDPPPQASSITFAPAVRSVQVLLPDGTVRTHRLTAERRVELPALRGGAGVLLRLDAEPWRTAPIPPDAVAVELPLHWKFRFDEHELAALQQWHAPDYDDRDWGTLRAAAYCGWKYQQGLVNGRLQEYGPRGGNGWYRVRCAAPARALKKHLYLHFGAADEESRVYVDGQQVLDHTVAGSGLTLGRIWKEPFHVEVSERFRDGKEHLVAVRVDSKEGAGGLYEPVYLIASDEPLDAEQLWRVHAREIRRNDWLNERVADQP